MGTGGITAIVVQVDKQKTAYVVIDGNNMISGLREKILAALTSVGFDESEVFTTDTHAVSALSLGAVCGEVTILSVKRWTKKCLFDTSVMSPKRQSPTLEHPKLEPFILLFRKLE